jgi:hypothetical protein
MQGLQVPVVPSIHKDKCRIDELTAEFFRLFSPTPGATVSLQRIHDLFIPQGIIVRTCGPDTEVFSIAEFIKPRELLFNDGSLVDFCEVRNGKLPKSSEMSHSGSSRTARRECCTGNASTRVA